MMGLVVILISIFLLASVASAAALPEETHDYSAIDPADRKFYYASASAASHELALIDAADRKFFSGNYRGWEVSDSLRYVDAADRKFFTNEYGAAVVSDRLSQVHAADIKFSYAN